MKWLAVSLAAIGIGALAFAFSVRADDEPGCEGLAEYREAMFAAAEPMPMEPDDNVFTMSSSDWLALAESSLDFHDRLAAIEPPAWAAAWHEVRLDAFGFREQLGRAAAESGAFIILGFEDTIDAIVVRDDATRLAAIEACSDFAQFADDWDALDGENRDGTPVATPIR